MHTTLLREDALSLNNLVNGVYQCFAEDISVDELHAYVEGIIERVNGYLPEDDEWIPATSSIVGDADHEIDTEEFKELLNKAYAEVIDN